MTPEQIRSELETALPPSDATLRAAVAHAEALAPAVIELTEKAAAGVFLIPQQERHLFYGLHILAAARHKPLYRPLLRLLRRRTMDDLEGMLGDAMLETIGDIAFSVYDGVVAPLIAIVVDADLDGYLRWHMLDVLAQLALDGTIPRSLVADLLDRFERDRLADDGDAAWTGWQIAVATLGLAEMAERVRASWRDGRNPEREADQAHWEDLLREVCADPANPESINRPGVAAIDDPVEALDGLVRHHPYVEEEPPAEPPKRTDPAAKIALNAGEENWLAAFLECEQVPETTMPLERLDGFLTALVVGPEMVPPREFMAEIWGTPDGQGPVFDSREQAEYVNAVLRRWWNTIVTRLNDGYPYIPFLERAAEGQERGEEWAAGFMHGMVLRRDAWMGQAESEEFRTFFGGILLLSSEARQIALEEGDTVPEREKLVEALPLSILGMHMFWREMDDRPEGWTGQRRRAKVGRNEPCPCGSGRKYKRCCGK